MNHFITTKEYDGYIDVLRDTSDYEYLSESKCKLCGFRPHALMIEAGKEIAVEVERKRNDFKNGGDLELIMKGERYVLELVYKRYDEKIKKNEKCERQPSVIKTRDIEFVDFLVKNKYIINNVIPIGRQKEKSSSSSETQTYKGLFRFAQKTESSSYSRGERRDIGEYTLIKA